MIVKGKWTMNSCQNGNFACLDFFIHTSAAKDFDLFGTLLLKRFNLHFFTAGKFFYLGLHIWHMYLYLPKKLGFDPAVNWHSGKAAVGFITKYVKIFMLMFLAFSCAVWFPHIRSETFHVLDTCAIKLLCNTKYSTNCRHLFQPLLKSICFRRRHFKWGETAFLTSFVWHLKPILSVMSLFHVCSTTLWVVSLLSSVRHIKPNLKVKII